MSVTILILAMAFAAINWYSVARPNRTLELISKPGTTAALLAWFFVAGGYQGHAVWFAYGLFFSLVGDILLMLPKEQLIPGLASFLIGHVCYIIGFNPVLPPINLPGAVLTVFVGLAALRILRGVGRGLRSSGEEKLLGPVLAYSIIISLMLLSALFTLLRPEWAADPAMLASSGALLFFISDSILAWSKFVHPIHMGTLMVMVTYHLGQALIAIGVILHYSLV